MPGLDALRWGPASKARPQQLVVICHGLGADAHDVIDLAHAWAHACPDAVFASVDAPFIHDSGMGRQWWSVADRTPSVMEAGARTAAPYLDTFIDDELQRLNLQDFAIMGFSQGAMITLYTGLRRSSPAKALLAFSGALIGPESLSGELANHTPVTLIHGEIDDAVPVSRSHDAEAILRSLQVPVDAHYVPGLGHWLDDTAISLGALALQRAFAL